MIFNISQPPLLVEKGAMAKLVCGLHPGSRGMIGRSMVASLSRKSGHPAAPLSFKLGWWRPSFRPTLEGGGAKEETACGISCLID